MKPIVEDLVARKNNFAKWLNLTFAFIFLATALKVAFRGISFFNVYYCKDVTNNPTSKEY